VSKRQEIVDAILTLLSIVRYPVDTDEVSVGCRVFDWRKLPPAKKDVPAIVVWDLLCEISPSGTSVGYHRHTLTVEVGVFVDSKFTPKQIRSFCETIVHQFSLDPFLGDILEEPVFVSSINMSAADVGEVIVAAVVGLSCVYKTEVWCV